MKPKAIIFDFFGVICTNVAGNWFKKHLPRGDALFIHDTMRHADLGKESEQEIFSKLATVASVNHDVREHWLSDATINQELIAVIRELKKSYKLAVCTNAPADFFRTVLKGNDIEKLFDVIVVSSEVGLVKPEKEIFELVCKKLEVSFDEAVFVDDSEMNVKKAKDLGMQGIFFSSHEQLFPYL
ncbi:MAG: glucose-phosphatase [Patescibacteria group bacterium]|nr:glucose-phosphatase [Patescibacteria group bacterium]